MTLVESRREIQELRAKLHVANARIAELEGKATTGATVGKDSTDRAGPAHKKIDAVKTHG